MPPFGVNKALPTPTRYFISNFFIVSFIFIENKCLSNAMRFEKGDIFFGKRWARVGLKRFLKLLE